MKIITRRFIWVLLYTLFSISAKGQPTLKVEYPSSAINGYLIAVSADSNLFYLFNHDKAVFDMRTKSISNTHALDNKFIIDFNNGTFTTAYTNMDINYTNPGNGIIVYRDGIYKTADSGKTWTNVLTLPANTQYAVTSYFTAVDFIDDSTGFAVGTADKIYKTTDGGSTWSKLRWSSSTAPYIRFSDVEFISQDTGYVTGFEVEDIHLNIGAYTPIFYKTTDGGQTWSEYKFAESDHHYVNIHTTNSDTIYLSIINRNYIFPEDKVVRSTDGGTTWEDITIPGTSPTLSMVIRNIHWFTSTECIILGSTDFFGDNNKIYKTNDAGDNWTEIVLPQGTLPNFPKLVNQTMTFSGNNGIITGASGNILYSNDMGNTWTSERQGLPDITCLTTEDTTVYAAAAGGLVLRKDGVNWTEITAPVDTNLNLGFDHISKIGDKLILVDMGGRIHISKNNGQSWDTYFESIDTFALSVEQLDDKILVFYRIKTSNLHCRMYDNSFTTYEHYLLSDAYSTSSSYASTVLNSKNIVIQSHAGVLISKDGAKTWNKVTTLPANAFTTSFNIDKSGFCVMQTEPGNIVLSKDEGVTWKTVNIASEANNYFDLTRSNIKDFKVINDSVYYVLVYGKKSIYERINQYALVSTDSGKNWSIVDPTLLNEPLETHLKPSSVVANNTLYFGSSNGTIYSLGEEPILTSVSKVNSINTLMAYPNPARELINIAGLSTHTNFKLYNAAGQVVQAGQLSPNNSTIYINNDIVGGIYYLGLSDSKQTQIIKIVLLS